MSIELFSLERIQELAQDYGYWTIFFGILLENAGIPIPGETITLVGGFLSGSGQLNYWWVLLSATAGALLGDNFGYWIGLKGGWPLLLKVGQFFRIQEEQLLEVREQFSQNADKAVFFGRFVALLRIFAGPLAGIAQMPYPRFFLCNLAGAAAWATVMVSLSYFVGQLVPLEQLIQVVAQFGVVALVIITAAIAIPYWLEHRPKTPKPIEPQE